MLAVPEYGDETETRVLIDNSIGRASTLVLEPWAEEISLKENEKIMAIFIGPKEKSCVTIELKNDSVILYGWPGALIKIEVNGQHVNTVSTHIQSI
jgi:hypothetical protein